MGILNAVGVDNGFTDWWSGNRNTIAQFGAGLAAGRNPGQGVALGLQQAQQGRVADDAYATAQKEEANRQAQLNQTIQFLQNKMPDLADALSAGAPMGEVWGEAMRRMQPQTPERTKLEFRDVGGDVLGIDPYTGKSSVVYDGQPERAAAPSGYNWTPTGELAPITGGPADPAIKRNAGIPPATLQKEIFETDEAVLAGENVLGALDRALELNKGTQTRAGWGADIGATVGANLPDWVPGLGGNEKMDAQTLELKNLVTAQALESLKAVFGAMPTEGERKILLEIQGSVDQPREVREAIFKRARIAAQRRLDFNRKKSAALRSGQYFEDGYAPQDTGGNMTSTGVPWSYEP